MLLSSENQIPSDSAFWDEGLRDWERWFRCRMLCSCIVMCNALGEFQSHSNSSWGSSRSATTWKSAERGRLILSHPNELRCDEKPLVCPVEHVSPVVRLPVCRYFISLLTSFIIVFWNCCLSVSNSRVATAESTVLLLVVWFYENLDSGDNWGDSQAPWCCKHQKQEKTMLNLASSPDINLPLRLRISLTSKVTWDSEVQDIDPCKAVRKLDSQTFIMKLKVESGMDKLFPP